MTTPRKDYLKYLKMLAAETYHTPEETVDETDSSWIFVETPAKEKMKNVVFSGIVDATKMTKEQIKAAIGKCRNIQVFDFSIRLSSYYGKDPSETQIFSFSVFEKKYKTPNGMPCNMDLHLDVTKDSRFSGRPWLHHFSGSHAREVPFDTIVDIVKWMQAVKKLSAFL